MSNEHNFKQGNEVYHKATKQLMVVEEVDGENITCSFDIKNDRGKETFKATSLTSSIFSPGIISHEPNFKQGSEVSHKVTKKLMVIEEVDGENITCSFGTEDGYGKETFKATLLTSSSLSPGIMNDTE